MNRPMRILALLLLQLILGAGDSQGQSSTTLSFAPFGSGGQPVVQALVNERTTVSFLIDTGSNVSVITDSLAAELKLSYEPPSHQSRKPAKVKIPNVPLAPSTISRLALGSVQIADVPIFVIESKHLPTLTAGNVQGILGTDILSHMAVYLDFNNKKITLWLGGCLKPDGLKKMQADNPVVLPLHRDAARQQCHVRVTLNGQLSRDFLVDTGAWTSCISYSTARQLKVKPLVKGISGVNIWGEHQNNLVRLESVKSGNFTLSNLLVLSPLEEKETRNSPDTFGLDLLELYAVLLDFPAAKMYLWRSKPASHAGIGIDVRHFNPSIWMVTGVDRNSPAAEAKVLPGDVIVEVNGQTTKNIEPSEMVKQFRKQPGSEIRLKLRRSGNARPITVRLKVRNASD